jgi:hypothetical protein
MKQGMVKLGVDINKDAATSDEEITAHVNIDLSDCKKGGIKKVKVELIKELHLICRGNR